MINRGGVIADMVDDLFIGPGSSARAMLAF